MPTLCGVRNPVMFKVDGVSKGSNFVRNLFREKNRMSLLRRNFINRLLLRTHHPYNLIRIRSLIDLPATVKLSRNISTGSTSEAPDDQASRNGLIGKTASIVLISLVISKGLGLFEPKVTQNQTIDSKSELDLTKRRKGDVQNENVDDDLIRALDGGLFLWGSNRNRLILSNGQVDVVKRPSVVHFLKRTKFFKDLKLHERYGAAVDQAGDLFLWGPEVTKTDESVPILEGYDIRQIACTTHKLYALSRKGQVYVLDISQRDFDDVKSSSKYSNWYWLGSWLGYHQPLRKRGIQILQVDPSDRPLDRRESFTSIAAGDNHLLALTSDGRTFASPVNLDANDHGQLGVKRVRINYSESQSESIELAPTAIEDFMHTNKQRLKQNQARITQQLKLSSEQQVDQPPPESEDSHTTSDPPKPSARDTTVQSSTFCTILHEIPELRSANVIDIACGSSHSLVRTSSGEVYGFGANQFGQIGAGPQLIFSGLISPTKTRLSDSQGTVTKCVSIAAGGDLSFFVIESLEPKRGSKSVDVLACGNGQFGGIGNGQWMNQATPTRVKTISGLTEWSESEKKTKPIGIHSISVGKNHVAVVLDNLINMDGKEFGRDVLIWGQGSEYQIGNQKRTNLSIPQHVSPLNVIPSPKPEKMIFSKESNDFGNGDKDCDRRTSSSLLVDESLIKSGTESPMPHSRLQLRGKRKVGKVLVEQAVVTGWGTTGVYWKIVE